MANTGKYGMSYDSFIGEKPGASVDDYTHHLASLTGKVVHIGPVQDGQSPGSFNDFTGRKPGAGVWEYTQELVAYRNHQLEGAA